MILQKDFKELLELFNAHGVEYLVVGGYALAFHGARRATGDLADVEALGEGKKPTRKKRR